MEYSELRFSGPVPRRKFFSEKYLNFAREIFHISPLPFPNPKGSERNVSNMQIKAIDASISTMGFGFRYIITIVSKKNYCRKDNKAHNK